MNKTEDDELGNEELTDEELRSITGQYLCDVLNQKRIKWKLNCLSLFQHRGVVVLLQMKDFMKNLLAP